MFIVTFFPDETYLRKDMPVKARTLKIEEDSQDYIITVPRNILKYNRMRNGQ